VEGWLDVIGGYEGWCGEEWERWYATSKREEDLAGAEAFLGKTDTAGWGLAMLYPMLPASSESVDERFPYLAETAIFPVHVVWAYLDLDGLPDHQSTYVALVERTVVSCSLMHWSRLMLCLATADLSGCSRRMWRWCSLILVLMEQPVCPI
jgi:hypothetical protein